MNKNIRIILVEHNELIRYGLRRMLEHQKDIAVVGDYASAAEAFPEIARLRPDIVVMDTQMPEMNGIAATYHLKRNGLNYDGEVIMLAESANYRGQALAAGAASYLLKDMRCTEIAVAIREVYWKKLVAENTFSLGETVDVVVPASANGTRLWKFMCQLEERINTDNNYNCASILHTVGSWTSGIVITMLVPPFALIKLMETLESIPEVEKVDESTAEDAFFAFPKKFGVLLRSSTSPSKRLCVTLKEAETVKRELATVLN